MVQREDPTPEHASRRVAPGRASAGWLILMVLLVFFAGCSAPLLAAKPTSTLPPTATAFPTATLVPPTPTASGNNTPTYTPARILMAQVVAVGPVYVTGDQTVPAEALEDAGLDLAAMLQHRPDVAVRLRAEGAFTAVASHDERICDLPYFDHFSATLCNSYGQGGAGGTLSLPVTACDERNLLKEPDDPYERGSTVYGQNICVHELAHTIMDVGLTKEDRDRIQARFLAAQQEGLWTGDYAMTNDMEFWAMMSEFYFSAGPNAPYSPYASHVANGPDKLKQYDPETFALLDSIYEGSTDLS